MAQWEDLFERVGHTLLDTEHVRWTEPELLLYAQDALRTLVKMVPDQYGTVEVWPTEAGTKQTLPPEAESLLAVLAETDSEGNEFNAVRFVEDQVLDSFVPGWRSGSNGLPIANYLHDARDPRTYYLYPGPAEPRHVLVRFARRPDLPEAAGDTVDAPDEYLPALVDYLLSRAFMKDADNPNSEQRAMTHRELFAGAVTGHMQVRHGMKPRANEPPAQGTR